VVLNSPVTGCRVLGGGHGGSGGGGLQAGGRLLVSTPELDLEADDLVNCAGLEAARVARLLGGMPPRCVPSCHVAKGSYFGLTGKSPFSRLVYPVPEAAGLGVHATVDLGGRCRFGPDVEWVEAGAHWDYQVDAARAASFYAKVRKYWPALPDGALVADYAGARPKLQAPGEAAADFAVQTEAEHGVAGLVHLFGIESPGLTASMALAGLVEAFLVKGAPVGCTRSQ
jgi:L-2-hydroxyglutarate oxidase LhgO